MPPARQTVLIGLSSPRLSCGWKAGWLQAGQAEGRPMGAQCGGEMGRAGPVIVPVQPSQTHFLQMGKCLLRSPSLPRRVAVLVVWSTPALHHPVTTWTLDHPTPRSR